jgi:hypothetical protein
MGHRMQQRSPAGDTAQAPPRNLSGRFELGARGARGPVRGKAGRAARSRSDLARSPGARNLAGARRLGRGIALGQNLRRAVADISG